MNGRRPAELERLLGDPLDPDSPLGHRETLAADERGEPSAAAEAALDTYGLNAEFVPVELGGRLDRLDRLSHVLRPVFRRDCALGVGYGITGFIAGVGVWSAGSTEQRRRAAELLLSGGRIAAAYTELAHGSDVGRGELRTEPGPDGSLLLTGGKQMINNIERADAAVTLARTGDDPGSRSHSQLLIDLTTADRDKAVVIRPRLATSALRGCHIAGVDFTRFPLGRDSIVGEPGRGLENVMRAFQVTRAVLPGMMLGGLDTQLRTVLAFALERRLYGRSVAELPYVRSALTGAFADLLVCDSLATVTARSLHLRPEHAGVLSALSKYLVADLVQDAAQRLAAVLGARSFLREGPYGIVQKMLRDLPVAALAHAGGTVCRASVVPQLPALARRGWREPEPAPADLFRVNGALPPLDYGRLQLTPRGADVLTSVLGEQPGPREPAELAALCAAFTGELRRMAEVELPPGDRAVTAGPDAFALAARYAVVLAAAACVGIWRHNRADTDRLLADPAWAITALRRLAARIGLRVPPGPHSGTEAALFALLLERRSAHRSFDLYGDPLAGQPHPLPALPADPRTTE
ncbi:acyl-CoA dehydrogenase [Streptomyces sp. NPDC051020]|uniref:acyl-CoA dehydrogenase n=1 Tax=Streptomyces sp. NPDC051020 TaxID=3155409 RepID=UPI0034394EC7